MSTIIDGSTGITAPSGAIFNGIASGTAVASTSGTSITFTSIPNWVKRVTVMFSGVSISSTASIQAQLGSGSVTTSGYVTGTGYITSSNSNAITTVTSGIPIYGLGAAYAYTGAFTFTLLNSSTNLWVCNASFNATSSYFVTSAGSITLSGVLDRLRITTTSTDTFDAGSINILYE